MGLARFPLAAVGGWLLILSAAQAAIITVNTTTDEWTTGGDCSIREALDRVRVGSNGRGCTATAAYGTNDTIVIPAGTYTLTRIGANARSTGDLDVERGVTLQGAGGSPSGTVIDASGLGATVESYTNVIEVLAGITAVFNDIQLQGGRTNGNRRGAGVQNNGTLTLNRCAVVNNTGSVNAAGGIGNGADGTLFVSRSYIGGNSNASSAVAAGTHNNGGAVSIVNSTYGGNSGTGPGVYHRNDGSASMFIEYTTFEANARALTAEAGPVGVGTSILNGSCTTTGGGSIADSGYNTDSGTGCGLSAGTSQSSTAIALPAAAFNGGTTLNYLIDTSTPAYSRIPSGTLGCGSTVAVDQRGSVRPAAPTGSVLNCDIGAIEIAFSDFGDAPIGARVVDGLARNYGDAPHAVSDSPLLFLGQVPPDSENGTQDTGDEAQGDNLAGIDDEDGVSFSVPGDPPSGIVEPTVTVTNLSGQAATLCGWMDFGTGGVPTGQFSTGHGVCVTVPASGGSAPTCVEATNAPGLFRCAFATDPLTLPWAYSSSNAIDVFARFRLASTAMTAGNATGAYPDGEVEDYWIPQPVNLFGLRAQLYCGMVADPDPVVIGDDLDLITLLDVPGSGGGKVKNGSVTITVPTGLTFVSVSSTDDDGNTLPATCNPPPVGTPGEFTVTCTLIDELPTDKTWRVTVTVGTSEITQSPIVWNATNTCDNGCTQNAQCQGDPSVTRATISAFRVGLVSGDGGDPIDPDTGEPLPAGVALVQWETLSEQGTLGFYLERWDAGSGHWIRLHGDLLPGLIDAPLGGEYRLLDRDVAAGERHRYRLIELEAWGTRIIHGHYDIVVGAEQAVGQPRGSRSARVKAVQSGAETKAASDRGGWRRLGADFEGRHRIPTGQASPAKPLDRPHSR